MIAIKVTFFANFKELLNCSSVEVELDNGAKIADLCATLALKGDNWSDLFLQANKIKVACNQQMTEMSSVLQDNDEVAFFPPVTGG